MAFNFSPEVLTRNRVDLVPASLDNPAAAIIGCMDEAIVLGKKTVLFGIAGSGITNPEGGDENVFPIKDRVAFQRVMPEAARLLQEQASRWGTELHTTYHPGCAAAAKQGIEPGNVGRHTEQYSQELGLQFAGGLQISQTSEPLQSTLIEAGFRRPTEVHSHDAEAILATINGGISGIEKARLEKILGPVLVVSADWAAPSSRRVKKDDIAAVLGRQIAIGQAIAPAGTETPIHFFDAGRLGYDLAQANRNFVMRLLSR